MKVVLFCGGLGTRLREFSEIIPKPLVNVGYRRSFCTMRYAHYGRAGFHPGPAGWGRDDPRAFLNNERMSNDFAPSWRLEGRALSSLSRYTGASPSSTAACTPTSPALLRVQSTASADSFGELPDGLVLLSVARYYIENFRRQGHGELRRRRSAELPRRGCLRRLLLSRHRFRPDRGLEF
jgi:hypothetical protein